MKPYSAIHQFHSGTSAGDAVTRQMFRLQEHLRSMGFESDLFAEHIDARLSGEIHSIDDYAGSENELLLVHHSMGHDKFDAVTALANDIVTVFHNITPASYFEDPVLKHYVRLGRDQLKILARRSQAGVADSNFNRREMLKVGFRRVDVLPVRTDFQSHEIDGSARIRTDDWLFVGRVVPNKCQHELVGAFAEFAQRFNSHARLILIGDAETHGEYVASIRSLAEQSGVADRIEILGKVSDSELLLHLAKAGAFVSLSEHEGFGVPLLEAMAAGVPVVAFGASAVPETMGGAGILLRTKSPEVVAATVQAIQTDPAMRQRLVARQLQRVDQIGSFDTRGLLERVVKNAATGGRDLDVQIQGPFETSYSLARVNRRLAETLSKMPGVGVSIYATEGPGDYTPEAADLARWPMATELYRRSVKVPYPDVVIRQMWPPRVLDSPGGITLGYFAWEESTVPRHIVEDFNKYLDGIGVTSEFVKTALRDSGVDVPIEVVGNGVDMPDPKARCHAPELESLRPFRFLHVSSGFPRKGVDALLVAYFAEFTGAEDVSLILKTFPNPHNHVGDQLAELRARHVNPPDVRWIDRDLDEESVDALYAIANCYVHPSRGEGFGLPVAEAMAAGVPVIATAHSGLADFVSDATATTIPYTIEPAQTHLATPGSTWAEPDVEQLRAAMRHLFSDPTAPDVEKRATQARELIRSQFSWQDAADRWTDFIRHIEGSAQTPSVSLVSTWNSRCGIADYSRHLVEYAGDTIDFRIFADKDVAVFDQEAELGIRRSWASRWNPGLEELNEALELADQEVVHFQFNFTFFDLDHMAALIERHLPQRGIVVTLHRTSDPLIYGKRVSIADIAGTLRKIDRIIVHQDADAERLRLMGLHDNVSIIHIGTQEPLKAGASETKLLSGLGSRPVVGTFGFLLPHKGTLELLDVIDGLRKEYPEIHLLAFSARHPDPASAVYEAEVREAIRRLKLEANVTLATEFLPEDVVQGALMAADVIVLPYHPTEESASAALRFVLPLGKPLITTDLPIFADARDALRLVQPGDTPELTAAIGEVLQNPQIQHELSHRTTAAARRFRWSLAVAQHREIYTAIRAVKQARSSNRTSFPRTD
jgi:glycosyltransferase involved in cell wall biosynthesis